MITSRRHLFRLLALPAVLAISFSASFSAHASMRNGKIFTSSNATDGNIVLVYEPAADGSLALFASVATGGLGSGAGLGSQGAVTLSRDGHYLFVVNALSNTVTTLALRAGELKVTSIVTSGGLHPISVAEHDGVVYVLNDQGEGSIAGYRNDHGDLKPIPGSVRGLSASAGTAAAQVGFGTDGDVLVVTEKGTNRITSYPVMANGLLGDTVVTPSAGLTPFGFAFDPRNNLIVSEAFGGAPGASAVSSYRFTDAAPASPLIVSSSVGTTQSAACWVAITPNGKWAYVTNTASSTVSSYRLGGAGKARLAEAVAAGTGEGSAPLDAAISPDGGHLYVLSGGVFTISTFSIATDGGLMAIGGASGLPASSVGLAAN